MFDIVISGAQVLLPTGLSRVDVAISNGQIAALPAPEDQVAARDRIAAEGLTLLPGAIDTHGHVRAPAFPERGTVLTETSAAAAGGVTTILEMPVTIPTTTSVEQLHLRRAHFERDALVNFGLYAGLGGIDAAQACALREAGALAFKIFTTAVPPGREAEFDGLACPSEDQQFRALEAANAAGLPLTVHCENAGLLKLFGQRSAGSNKAEAGFLNAARPAICEAVAVAAIAAMNAEIGAKLHIAHVTSERTAEVLRRFSGLCDLTAEVCPQSLYASETDLARAGVDGKTIPPIRYEADSQALWRALADGTITQVATDHAPFDAAEKQASAADFATAPAGVPGLEILVPAMLDAVATQKLTLPKAWDLVSASPARRFGLQGRKGEIAVGRDADLILVDMSAPTEIRKDTLFTQARGAAGLYAGRRFQGKVRRTIVGGTTVFNDGAITGRGGEGAFVPPA